MRSCSLFGYTNGLKEDKNILSHSVPSEKRNEEFCIKWIQSIKQTGNFQSYIGFFYR